MPNLTVKIGSETLAEIERRVILATLKECGGNKLQTARTLKISPKTLYNHLREYAGQSRYAA